MPENVNAPSTLVNGVTETITISSKLQSNGIKGPGTPLLPTVDEIRKAVPEHCFEKNLKRSMRFFMWDIAILTALYLVVGSVEHRAGLIGLFAWYWVMGMFLSSLFCIGHDCGHGSFSEYQWINDIVGHLSHGFLMVPYWPWQKSHRQHHKYTSHLNKDAGHPWITEDDHESRSWVVKNFAKFPLTGFIRWNPLYTILGLPDGSHFWPFSKLFANNFERVQCVVSVAVCIFFSYIMAVLCNYSVLNFIKYYYVPILFQGIWIIMITYLQHQDEQIEVYENNEWNFIRGQLQTIDRVYGFGIDYLLHHITDGHVAHHFFFTKIPHYNLPEATKAIRKVLEKYPGTYKRQSCYQYVFEFLRLNIKLDCLVAAGKGVLKYRSAVKMN